LQEWKHLTGEYLQHAQDEVIWQKKSGNIHKSGTLSQAKIGINASVGLADK